MQKITKSWFLIQCNARDAADMDTKESNAVQKLDAPSAASLMQSNTALLKYSDVSTAKEAIPRHRTNVLFGNKESS